MKKEKQKTNTLNMRLGSAKVDPKTVARTKRRMKGAERRISTHKGKIEEYRQIIRTRAITKLSKDDGTSQQPISEPELEGYRAKRLMEEAALLRAKLDFKDYRDQYEGMVGENADAIRDVLRSHRQYEHARRMAPKSSREALQAIKAKKGPEAIRALEEVATMGKRSDFRKRFVEVLRDANPKLHEQLASKPKLLTKVIERLVSELGSSEQGGGE